MIASLFYSSFNSHDPADDVYRDLPDGRVVESVVGLANDQVVGQAVDLSGERQVDWPLDSVTDPSVDSLAEHQGRFHDFLMSSGASTKIGSSGLTIPVLLSAHDPGLRAVALTQMGADEEKELARRQQES